MNSRVKIKIYLIHISEIYTYYVHINIYVYILYFIFIILYKKNKCAKYTSDTCHFALKLQFTYNLLGYVYKVKYKLMKIEYNCS